MPIRDLTESEKARLLTQVEVDKLPTGTRVMVKWPDGNGPYPYQIVHGHGFAWADTRRGLLIVGNQLSLVGVGDDRHKVFLSDVTP